MYMYVGNKKSKTGENEPEGEKKHKNGKSEPDTEKTLRYPFSSDKLYCKE